eukprot:Selendium_serpulae@DN6297_c0_g1_i1.p1
MIHTDDSVIQTAQLLTQLAPHVYPGLIGAGGAAGLAVGRRVQVTQLPQTVAAFHSLVGMAAMVTSIAHYGIHPDVGGLSRMTAIIGDVIGGITLSGSLVAFGKLNGNLSNKALNLPGKNALNIGMVATQTALAVAFMGPVVPTTGMAILGASAALSNVLGYHLVSSVGGADMPVCITVLNSYSGWALVAEGFMLNNTLMTIVGSLIGSSGGILSYIMCKAMNRSLPNVLFGGYATSTSTSKIEKQPHVEIDVSGCAEILGRSKEVMIIPGYGMAVGRAQYALSELAKSLREQGVNVRFGIHPVAGRMPGQMNVLLAEAGVPYDWVHEMEEINPDMPEIDCALVVGANDIVNAAAEEVDTPISGMPIFQVWKAKNCIFMKRTMGAGYADIDNPTFYKDRTQMLLGDAKQTLEKLVTQMKE